MLAGTGRCLQIDAPLELLGIGGIVEVVGNAKGLGGTQLSVGQKGVMDVGRLEARIQKGRAAASGGSSARATLASALTINSEPQGALRVSGAGIGLPHPDVDGQMLYLTDRSRAKTIARLTAAAPLEREHGSTLLPE